MAGTPLSAVAHGLRRRREDAVIAWAEGIVFERLRRSGRIGNPRQAEQFLRLRLAGLLHEELHAVWLDGHHRVIACDVLAKGAVDRAEIDPRVVVQLALQRNARAVILAHNHPSGVAVPSAEDLALTRRVREALALFDVELLAHLIVGDEITAIGQQPARRREIARGNRSGVA